MNPRVGVGILVRRRGELLLLRRHGAHGAGTWSPPGGNLDWGEEPAAAAARELLEETGIVGEPVFTGRITNDVFVEEERHYVTLWFELETDQEARLASPREASELAWFPADALPAPRFLPFENLLRAS
ncbi:MAG: NUDIX domain-containing protein [Actinomycetota bacterium]